MNPTKTVSNRFIGQIKMSTGKGHHRTSSSPIKFPPAYEDERENVYLNTVSRLSDSDSTNEQSYQRMFVNSQLLNDNRTQVRYDECLDHRLIPMR